MGRSLERDENGRDHMSRHSTNAYGIYMARMTAVCSSTCRVECV